MRPLLKCSALASATLFLLFCFLLGRSGFVRDDLDLKISKSHVLFLESSKGAFRILYIRDLGYSGLDDFQPLKKSRIAITHESPPSGLDASNFGDVGWDVHNRAFELGACYAKYIYSEKLIVLPDWFIVLVSSTLPLAWTVSRFKSRKRNAGLCPRCGYDIRASSNRCSECGEELST